MTKEIELITNPELRAKHMNRVEVDIAMKVNPRDLMSIPELRAKYIHRTDVLDMVGKLEFLPNTNLATSKQVAEFYGVKTARVHTYFHRHKEELLENGILSIDYREIVSIVLGNTRQSELNQETATELGISTRETISYTKTTALLMGFLLPKTPVTEKVRQMVLGINNNTDDLFEEPEQEEYAYQMFEPPVPVTIIENTSVGTIVVPNNTMPTVIVEPTIESPIQKEQYNMQVVNQDNQLVIDSRDVAEMVGKRHDNVMRDIATIISHLSNELNFELVKYFKESTYVDGKGEARKCYLLTKKGCELFATRMTGAKGTQFAVTYIEKFNQMEEQLKAQTPVASYMIENPIERAKQWIVEQEQKMLLETKVQEQVVVIEEQEEIIESQKEIIVNYIEDIPEIEMRQKIVDIIRKENNGNGYGMSKSYNRLYKEFNMTYHRNVALLTKNYNNQNKKNIGIIHYIEDVLGMIEELYELAVKIFIIEKEERLAKMLSEVDEILLLE